ncbi:MAG: ABC transporter substrate-binding protein, partial [Propionibacteriaceae bacterium]|nr:ABC transporter substrate-binding protein [Propionibacteriaceae bacterium]
MSRHRPAVQFLAAITTLVLSLSLAACGGDSAPAVSTAGAPPAISEMINLAGTVPEGPIYPADVTESSREVLIRNLFDGLVRLGPTGELVYEVAQSIETDDAITFTITIHSDRVFANGEAVTASSFIDAWNWGAYGPNAQKSASDYALIKGYDAVHPSAEGAQPTAEKLSGLTLIDDRTFTVELSEPASTFPGHLTDGVFFPLPKAFFEDPESFATKPIGNGPYQLRDVIDPSDGAYLDANPTYIGGRTPQNKGLYVRFYTSMDTIYQDVLAGNLDLGDAAGGGLLTAAADFGDRFLSGPGGPTQTLAFPLYDEFWGSENGLKVRQAISHAIDREAIIATIFNGLAAPAQEFTQPGLPGWSDSIPGVEVLEYDVELAKQLLQEAGGYPRA